MKKKKIYECLHVFVIWVLLNISVNCEKPASVKIGAVFTYDSVIGRAAKPAIEAAVSDINDDPTILNGTELRMVMENSQCNVFLGSLAAFQVLDKEVVALIGPLSSSIAHMISEIANGLKVPLISFAATDPTLSALQFPYFLRTIPSDSYQMAAMASLVDFYGWKEVIAIYIDNDYGRNGITSLDDELYKRRAKLSYKLPLPVQFDQNDIASALNKSRNFGPRVYVVHLSPDPRLRIFHIAHKLHMMTSDYVWFATDWFSTTLDSFSPISAFAVKITQGVIGLRQHIPQSVNKKQTLELNTYGLHAYDTVWTVAYAIDNLINSQKNIAFSFSDELLLKPTQTQLGKLKIFEGGAFLLRELLRTNFSGLSGQVQFGSDRSSAEKDFDVVNVDQTGIRTVGYWSEEFAFSVLTPETIKRKKHGVFLQDQELQTVTWPGGKIEKPRGWVITDGERFLKIGVPKRVSFVEFVTEKNNSRRIEGYCIDVFNEALKLVPYDVPYRFMPFGNGHTITNYNELVTMVANNVLDAAVGDIAIVTNRTKVVDFSQPFSSTGLVIVGPINKPTSRVWAFLKPFSVEMWCTVSAAFVMIAVVIWILEHRVNDDFRGPPRKQLATMFLFSFSTLFKKNQEDTVSPLGKFVMLVWLFLLMVITSSYTASLTSIITVEQLSSPITGIESLLTNTWPIGYQVGSYAYDYLSSSLYIPKSRLVPLGSPEEYERALRLGPKHGGVAAVVDELLYIELFLSDQTDFGIIGQPFTRSGWGFAFQRDSPLTTDISTAILKLSENGKLQEIHKNWFCKVGCPEERIWKSLPDQLQVSSFWGIYLICTVFSLSALLIFFIRIICQYVRFKQTQINLSAPVSSSSSCTGVIYSFFEFIDEREEAIKKRFSNSENVVPQVTSENGRH